MYQKVVEPVIDVDRARNEKNCENVPDTVRRSKRWEREVGREGGREREEKRRSEASLNEKFLKYSRGQILLFQQERERERARKRKKDRVSEIVNYVLSRPENHSLYIRPLCILQSPTRYFSSFSLPLFLCLSLSF